MTFIHLKPNWPSFTWDLGALAGPLAIVRNKQGRLLGRMEALGFDLKNDANLSMLTHDVVKSSAIEGEILPPDDVRSSIARHLGIEIAGLSKSAREVEGIVEMTIDATTNYNAPLTDTRLCRWHAALFPTGLSGLRRITVGAWRTVESGAMQVVSGPLGREKVHFEAPASARLPAEMATFLNWFAAPSSDDPVIRAAIVHFWFITIHPFADGNGRIARTLTDMALAQADKSAQRFYSMSAEIAARRRDYYLVLESTQRGNLDITNWLDWFLTCLEAALDRAETTLAGVFYRAKLWEQINLGPINDRQKLVINRLLDNFQGPLTTSKYSKIAKCSPDTALRDIQELLERKILVQNSGGGRSSSYRLVEV